MAYTFSIEEGVLKVNGGQILIPRDSNLQQTALLVGLDTTTGEFKPVNVAAGGKLETNATFSGTITVGAVKIEDATAANNLDLMKEADTVASTEYGTAILGRGPDSPTNKWHYLSLDASNYLNAHIQKIDDNLLNKTNITDVLTWVATGNPGEGNVATIKEYPTGAAGGTTARLITFTYNVDDQVTNIAITDTTV